MANPLYDARRRRSLLAMTLCVAATGFGLMWLVMILFTLFWNGIAGISAEIFTQMTPPPNAQGGGLLNAIVGSAILTALGIGVGAPIGILAGTYMAEYGRHSKLTDVIRFVNDILLSAPSIIIGLFVYGAVVIPMGSFSGLAGAIALAVIALPVIVRTTEDMLLLVPTPLREAAAALGMPRSYVVRWITWRAARTGLITGLLLAVARVSGETAPLLFTALNNQFFSTNMGAPMANLPVVIFQFAMSPYDNWVRLAWAGALLITLTVLVLNILARVFFREKVSA
jgi:phosphate transport system permease protein